jgi:hypothetical protein
VSRRGLGWPCTLLTGLKHASQVSVACVSTCPSRIDLRKQGYLGPVDNRSARPSVDIPHTVAP